MIRLIVAGACGKMGCRILELANQDPRFEIAGALESKNHPQAGKKILDGKVEVAGDLNSLKGSGDVFIDFTTPQATLSHLESLQSWKKISVVIGTTGFTPAEHEMIEKVSKKIPIVLSPNMSVGVNLMFDVVRTVAKKLSGYDIEIIETHHDQKKDAPSGTAVALAKEIADELKRNPEKDFVYGRKGNVGARTANEIGIHAVRAGDVVGDHTVIFATGGERIELTHRASSRDAFAVGALRAAEWVHKKQPGLYSMKNVLQ